MGEERKVYKFLVGKLEEKRPLGRQRRGWEDGIKMDPREICWGGRGGMWIQLALDRDRWLVFGNTVINLGFWRHGVSWFHHGNIVS
jgi:hypothetical protein